MCEQVSVAPDGSMAMAGFEKDHFVCLDLSCGAELLRVSCGGGHRSYGFVKGCQAPVGGGAADDSLAFCFIRSGQVSVATGNPLPVALHCPTPIGVCLCGLLLHTAQHPIAAYVYGPALP